MSSSISSDHDFAVNSDIHHSQYVFARLDKVAPNITHQRPRFALMHPQAQTYSPDDSASLDVDHMHRRHKSSSHHRVSSQILDLVSPSFLRLPKQPSDGTRQRDEDHSCSVTKLSQNPVNGKPHPGSSGILGRHISQLSGMESTSDKQTLHKRHQSASRQRFLRSSNPPVSPKSLVAMQDLKPIVPPDTCIFIHDDPDDHDDHVMEKDTPALGSLPTHRSLAFWLILYFCFNLGLTLYNKGVLIHFPFPYALTALHALCGTFGGLVLLRSGAFVPAKLNDVENLALLAFSVLYTINIAVSNISLELVTIPFHQVVRAASPIFTILLSLSLFGTRSSNQKMASLVPVMVGVGFATYGDYSYTTTGFVLTVLGTILAAIKTIYTSILQSTPSPLSPQPRINFVVPPRLQLHPLDLLTRMAPLAFIQCVILAHLTGELSRVRMWCAHEMTPLGAVLLGVNGIIAFGLNIVSFTANKAVGPLSMTVAANVKQVLSIFLAVIIFNLTITPTNALGILLTLAGGMWYAAVEYQEKGGRWRK